MSTNSPLEPIEDVVKRGSSGWEESLYNCTTGANYLRAGEYYELIRILDAYARENAALKSALSEPVAPQGGDARAVDLLRRIRENHMIQPSMLAQNWKAYELLREIDDLLATLPHPKEPK